MRASLMTALAAALLLVGAVRAADAPVDFAKDLDRLLPDMSSEDLNKRKAAQDEFSALCLAAGRPGAEAERAAACKAIGAKVGPETAEEARAWLIRQLQYIGRAESVPVLAKLLGDSSAHVRECARRALEANPSDEAGAALRAALDKAPDAAWRVAVINAVAQRRDAAAVGAVAKALGDSDESVALAAAAGLGKIAGPEAVKALADAKAKAQGRLRTVLIDSYLRCADRMVADGLPADAGALYQDVYANEKEPRVRLAGLRGLAVSQGEKAVPAIAEALTGKDETLRIMVMPFIQEIQGSAATKAFADLLPRLDSETQVVLLAALGDRRDPAAKPAIVAAAKSTDDSVRVAALKAMAGVGDASDALMLAETAASASGEVQNVARSSLAMLGGEKVDEGILAALPKADVKVRVELIRALGARKAPAALPTVMRLAADADASIRTEAIGALESMADEKAIGLLVRLVVTPKEDSERGAAEKALWATCARASNKDAAAGALASAMAGANGAAKASLLQGLSRIGGTKAAVPVRAALKADDAAVHDAAVRALSDWPDDGVMQDLLGIAQADAKAGNQVLALRGLVRLARESSASDAEKTATYQRAMAAAKRPDEKKLVLGALGEMGTLEALRLAAPLMDTPQTQEEAAQAAARIAKRLGGRLPDEVKTAMQKVLEVSKNARTRRDAEDVLRKFR